ncbi:MAG: vWA domain-containing protein [Bacilli bacterium]|nr:vWA domain-containing protein [Bacilli bacterium]
MNKRKKLKGYTMIELLASLAIISLFIVIIIFSSYSIYIKESKEKLKKIETQYIIDATNIYYNEYKDKEDYLSYYSDDKTRYSCISIMSLINKGYYKHNTSFLNKELTKENTVVKVKEKNGIANYEFIKNYKKDEDCIYYDLLNEINNDTELIINNDDDNNKISVTTNVQNNSNNKNSYILKLKLSALINEETISYKLPLYTLEVLDNSSSMTGNKYTNAVAASKTLSNNLIDRIDDSYIGLINFSKDANWRRDFLHQKLTDNDFEPIGKGTNILSALNMAYEKMKNIDSSDDTIKYVIFLTDGEPYASYKKDPRCNTYGPKCPEALKEYSDKIKNDLKANLIVIGYDIYNDIYKTIPSIDKDNSICPNSDYQKDGINYCYYSSDSSNIASLYDNISNSIERHVNSQIAKKAQINANFDKAIKLYNQNGEEEKNMSINIELNENGETLEKEYKYTIYIDEIDDSLFTCDYDKKTCEYNSKLFEEYYIVLFDKDNNETKRLTLENSPTISIKKELKSYIN